MSEEKDLTDAEYFRLRFLSATKRILFKDEQIKSFESRLSQAEDENNRLSRITATVHVCKCPEKVKAIEERLSHLMDVLKRLDIECQGTTCDCGSELKDWDIAKLVKDAINAEWDGIKNVK